MINQIAEVTETYLAAYLGYRLSFYSLTIYF